MNDPTGSTSSTPGEPTVSSAVKYKLAVATESVEQEQALPVLKEILGFNAIDGRNRLRHIPAVWPGEFGLSAAQTAAAKLRSLGIKAAAVPVDSIPDLRLARTLHRVACLENGFVVISLSGETEQTIPWSRVGLLSIADIIDVHGRTEGRLPDGVFRHDPGIADLKSRPEDHGLELWILCDPPFEAFRIVADMMNYEYLKERRTSSSADNFQNLICDILQYSSGAFLTPSTRDYLNSPTRALRRRHASLEHRDAVLAYWCARHTGGSSDG